MLFLRIFCLCISFFSPKIHGEEFHFPFSGLGPRETTYPYHGGPFSFEKQITAFGDSIMSGLNHNTFYTELPGGGVAEKLGLMMSLKIPDTLFQVHNRAIAGSITPRIFATFNKQIDRYKNSDIFLVDGGGNDLLLINHMGPNALCDAYIYEQTVDQITANTSNLASILKQKVSRSAKVIVMDVYYARYIDTTKRKCADGVTPVHPISLRAFAKINYRLLAIAKRSAARLLDAFALFNCAPSVRKNCEVNRFSSEAAYLAYIFNLDRKNLLRDATRWQETATSPEVNLLQKDQLHPNIFGHELLAHSFFQLLTKD